MPMLFLKELSQYKGETRLTNAVEIDWALMLKSRGFIDAEVEHFLRTDRNPGPSMQVVVRGLTAQGWAVMEILAPKKKPSWSERFGLGERKQPVVG